MAGVPLLRLGASACLLGEEVRYDGGHKRDRFLVETLGRFVQWVPVCPEMAIGMGTPRESVRLVERGGAVRMIASSSGRDFTDAMETWARAHLEELARARLHGFVLKKGSPSCGVFGVKTHRAKRRPARDGRGLFARELIARFQLLPVEEEGRLRAKDARENFVERLLAYERWLRLLDEDPTTEGLARFHADHELAVRAHSEDSFAKLGRMVARAGRTSWARLSPRYGALFMESLSVTAPRGRRANPLRDLARSMLRDPG